MKAKSNFLLHLIIRYQMIFLIITCIYIIIHAILNNEIDQIFIEISILLIFIIVLFYLNNLIGEYLFIVKMDEDLIYINKNDEWKEIVWSDVKSIKFTYFNIYKIEIEDEKFYFVPSDLVVGTGSLRSSDDFAEIINKKRKIFGFFVNWE